MNNFTDNQSRQLDFLLSDFNSLKSEISSRSNLQRIALSAYVALFAFIYKILTDSTLASLHIVAIWFGAFITLNYFVRQGKEINRLADIISNQIANTAGDILDIKKEELIPSETNQKNENYDNLTKKYNFQFKWLLFFVVPVFPSVFYLARNWNQLDAICNFNTRAPYLAIISVLLAGLTVTLLVKHVNEKMHNKALSPDAASGAG